MVSFLILSLFFVWVLLGHALHTRFSSTYSGHKNWKDLVCFSEWGTKYRWHFLGQYVMICSTLQVLHWSWEPSVTETWRHVNQCSGAGNGGSGWTSYRSLLTCFGEEDNVSFESEAEEKAIHSEILCTAYYKQRKTSEG